MDNDSYGDEQNICRLKDLAERLLDHDYHMEVDSDKPQLFLGELPTTLPADIPVPEGMLRHVVRSLGDLSGVVDHPEVGAAL